MSKRIVICCDGTWNTPDRKDGDAVAPSNVVKLARAIRSLDDEGVVQVVYYDEGVGARGSRLSRMWAGMTGGGLEENVVDAYRFLVENYAAGDDIYVFGFSRGAFTVRSLVGMLRKCGLLAKVHADRTLEAYWLYRDRAEKVDGPKAIGFRSRYGVPSKLRVQCIGVWDTVGALGIPWRPLAFTRKKHEFHDLALSTYVANAFQALAIDERRVHFPPAVWQVQAPGPNRAPVPLAAPGKPQRVEQVWFAGTHSNIGGGYADSGLSDLTLAWMKERAEECGLAFDNDYLAQIAHPNPFGVLRDSRTGLYRLFRARDRVIADPALPRSEESVHASAQERWDGDSRYRPRPLAEYQRRLGA
jgi:uncharacterized protein (DUF2235 family)